MVVFQTPTSDWWTKNQHNAKHIYDNTRVASRGEKPATEVAEQGQDPGHTS